MNRLIFVLVAVLLIAPVQCAAAQIRSDWEKVKALPAGTSMEVEWRDSHRVKGKLTGASDTAIMFARGGRTVEVPKADVRRIFKRRLSPWGPVLAGTSAGVVGGVIVGNMVGHRTRPGSGAAAALAVVGIGDGVGTLVWALQRPRMEIYDARQP